MGKGAGANTGRDGKFARGVGGEVENSPTGIVGDFLGFDEIEG